MPINKDAWGIEIGANAIKAMHLVRNGPNIELADFDIIPFKQILTTPDLDVDEAIRINLDQFMSRHDLSRSMTAVSVPGHMAFARFAKLPPVEPKRIPDIVKFEAVQQVPFPIDQVEWDYQVFQQEDSSDVEVGIFAITKDRVTQVLSNYRSVDLTVHAMTLSPLAMYNALAYDMGLNGDSSSVIFMDIGTNNTDVIIVDGGRIWLRTLPLGGNNFTEALVRAFKLSFPKAEKLKREAGTSKYARQIFQAMRPVFADLVQEMQRSLGYYQSLHREASLTKLVGAGSTFRLPGLQKFLKQQLQIEVIRPDGFSRISPDGKRAAAFSENAINLATAYGLALQGLGAAKVDANILPRSFLKQRVWRAKQPVFAAAAGLMVLASIIAGFRCWFDEKAYAANDAIVSPSVSVVLAKAQKNVASWNKIAQEGFDPRIHIENLRRILDYRDVWPTLLLDINMAAEALEPQPETLEADYEAVAKIPRHERRRIFIESIASEYIYRGAVSLSGDDEGEEGASAAVIPFEDPWANVDSDEPGKTGMGKNQSERRSGKQGKKGKRGSTAESLFRSRLFAGISDTVQPPAFQITVQGTTPFADGERIIAEHFIKWLQDNAKRLDRPYRIDTELLPKALVSSEPVGFEGMQDGEMPPRLRDPSFEMPGPLDLRQPDLSLDARRIAPDGQINLGRLIPMHPLKLEPHADDTRFTLQWRVILIRPDEAREHALHDASAAAKESEPKEQPMETADATAPDAGKESR